MLMQHLCGDLMDIVRNFFITEYVFDSLPVESSRIQPLT